MTERRLSAILAADVVGYSRLMGLDEESTLAALKQARVDRIDPHIAKHHGRIVKTMGDGILVEFPSVVDALRCAVAIQEAMGEGAAGATEERGLRLRIGVNLGDVIVEEGDIFGDGVNVAARLEGLAEPGGISVSQSVRELARGKLELEFQDLGEVTVKNIALPIRVYRVVPEDSPAKSGSAQPVTSQIEKSIAVLPFANMSPDRENEYFADGITEEILMALSKVRDLHVISRTSVMEYKGTSKNVRQIASELGVGHVLEGSVRRAGDRVRITSQLIDARRDRHLWAESYDRQMDDVFAIQSDVAQRIVDSLEATLTPAERARLEARPTESMEAYEWYLKGRYLIVRRTETPLRAAVEAFRKAVAADPGYAPAWSGLAEALVLLGYYTATPFGEVLPEARRAAERAVSIDPGLGEAHASLAFVAQNERSWDEAQREITKAIELAPGYATAYLRYGAELSRLGRYDEAIAVLERARQLDPASLPIRAAPANVYAAAGDLARAETIWREALDLDSEYMPSRRNLAELYEAQDRLDEALAEHEALSRLAPERCAPEFLSRMRSAYAAEGPPGYWRAKVEWLEIHGRTAGDTLDLATALLRLGREDESLDRLQRLVEKKSPMADQIAWLPQFEPLRSNPRFEALVRRIRSG